jgi:hypothetical protein
MYCWSRQADDVFHLTTVMIPKQHATSDSCDTLDDVAILEHVERHGLMVLGWIHTHPSQTRFGNVCMCVLVASCLTFSFEWQLHVVGGSAHAGIVSSNAARSNLDRVLS